MTDRDIRSSFLSLAKAMTTQAHAVVTQSKFMKDQENPEVRPCVKHNACNMASHLRDFTRMNPPMFFWYKVNQDPKDFLDAL